MPHVPHAAPTPAATVHMDVTFQFDIVYCRSHEIHFAVHFDQPQGVRQQIARRWTGFLAYRFVQFLDQVLLVAWCSNCACGRASCPTSVFEGGSYGAGMSKSACMPEEDNGFCFIATQLLRKIGDDESYLKSLIETSMRSQGVCKCAVWLCGCMCVYVHAHFRMFVVGENTKRACVFHLRACICGSMHLRNVLCNVCYYTLQANTARHELCLCVGGEGGGGRGVWYRQACELEQHACMHTRFGY